MIHKYYYDLVKVWYLINWFEECVECGKLSDSPLCMSCGAIKPNGERKVTDKTTLRKLNTNNPDVIKKMEGEIHE